VLLLLVVLLPACARVLPSYNVPQVTLGEPSFFPTLEAYTQSPIVGGNRVDILLNGDGIFPTLIQDIRQARHTITYAQYFYAQNWHAAAARIFSLSRTRLAPIRSADGGQPHRGTWHAIRLLRGVR